MIHQRRRMKKPDGSKARNIFTFTPKANDQHRIDDCLRVERACDPVAVQ